MKLCLTLLLSTLLAGSLFAQTTEEITEKQLNVAIGIDEVIKFDYQFNSKVKLGTSDVLNLSISPKKREITFKGVKAGKTSVYIYDASGDVLKDRYLVNVTSDGNSNTVRELRDLLGDIEGIEIGIRGGKVIVGGEIIVPDKIGRITAILSKYPDVLLLIEYSKQTQTIIAREMQDAINRNGMKDVTVNVVNGDYWLEGVVNSAGKKDLSENIAKAYLPDTLTGLGLSTGGNRFQGKIRGGIISFVNINEKKDPDPPPKLIKISSQFVELSKDYLKVFAFKWAPFMSNESSITFGKNSEGGISTGENGTLSGTISRLFPKLQSARNAGYARIIQSGMAVTNNDKTISIKKSSKLNFAVGTGDGQEAKEADITFSMSTKPVIRNNENVELADLNIQVSLPNGSSTSGAPQVTSNQISTFLTVKSNESAVIGGIVQSNSSTSYDKNDPDPAKAEASGADGGSSAAQAANLFNLLRSKSYTTAKSQFVVFVTPEILDSASKGTAEIKQKFKKRSR